MKYFNDCVTLADLKSAYKGLSKINHPDAGGDEKIMSAINVQYEKLEAKLSKKNTPKDTSVVRTAKAGSLQKIVKPNTTQLAKMEDSPLMKLKKQMLGSIVRKAWYFKKQSGLTLSKAFSKAWAWFKQQKVKGKVVQNQLSML